MRYAIIGAGMAGMLAAIKLLERGCRDLIVYEKGHTIGGTWRENTYPGLTCDVPSHSYTYSFELNPDWTRTQPPGHEVQAYFERVKEKYGLENWITFNEEVVSCIYQHGGWQLQTASGRQDSADAVIAATGVLHHPRYPDISGIDVFQGAIFHSAEWDHSTPLDGQRIAIIGTGSTGVQLVSALSARASALTHFQRSPQWIMPVEDRAYTTHELARFKNNPDVLQSLHYDEDLESNIERFTAAITNPDSEAMKEIETIVADFLEMVVTDADLREKIRPDYRAACKRLIYSPNFYQTIQRDNVEVLVENVTRIEAKGIRAADGRLREFDVIVLATGYKPHEFMRPMNVVGRNGTALNDVWQDKPVAYLAISIPDFPNFFMLNGPNGPVGNFSLIEIAECQWAYIEQLLAELETGNCQEISATQQAMAEYETARVEQAKKTIFASGCSSWYLDSKGIPATWPWTRRDFKAAMQRPDLSHFNRR